MNDNANKNNDLQDLVNTKLANAKPIDYTAAAVNDTPPEQGDLYDYTGKNIAWLGNIHQDLSDKIKNRPPKIKTGFTILDNAIGGLQSGVSIIGATAGRGKTTFACQICEQAAQNGVKCVFLSLEMDAQDIYESIAAIATKTLYNKGDDYDTFSESIETKAMSENSYIYSNIAIYDECTIDPTPHSVIKHIAGITKKIRDDNGENQEILIVIDYLQYIRDINAKGEEWQTFANASMLIERAAKLLNIKILLISQVTKDATRHQENGLQIGDFSGGGRIGYGAKTIIGLTETKNPSGLKINICKNRGKSFNGFIYFDFNGLFLTEKECTEPLPLQDNKPQSQGEKDACFYE